MRCVILQPSYIPWRGYFHQMKKADIFVFYDDVQYGRRSWRNRNKIKTSNGPLWLSIPVFNKNHQAQGTPINKIKICWDTDWKSKHLNSLMRVYKKTPYFERYLPVLEDFYSRHPVFLADFSIDFSIAIAEELRIKNTKFIRSSSLKVDGTKTDRLLKILNTLGATHYITGPAAKDYIQEDKFNAHGIQLEYMTYEYPKYEQLYPPYDPEVSILDLLFMKGEDASNYIWEKDDD